MLQCDMDSESGAPLDMLQADVLKWLKSIGSKAKTVSEIVKTHDPSVSEAY